jgi:hypothetical protein
MMSQENSQQNQGAEQGLSRYQQARRDFRWEVAEDYNFAIDTIGTWAEDSAKLAMLWVGQDGTALHVRGLRRGQ